MFVEFSGKNGKPIRGEVIMTKPRLKRLRDKLMKIEEFAFDTETTSLNVQHKGKMDIVGISICFGGNNNYYIPIGHFFDEGQLDRDLVMKYLKRPFERTDVRIIGHNVKFDMHVLACFDVNIKTDLLFDTLVASTAIDENRRNGLKELTSLVYGVSQTKFDTCLSTVSKEEKKAYGLKGSQKPPFHLVRIPTGAPYAMADAYWTWHHYCDWQLDLLEKEGVSKIFNKVMMPFLRTLYNMERRGAKINKEKLRAMQKKAEKDLAELEYKIIEIAGVEFNVGSSQQLAEILFGYKKFSKTKDGDVIFVGNKHLLEYSFNFEATSVTKTGMPSTGKNELTALAKQNFKKDKRKQDGVKMIKLILEHKKLSKLKSAFIDGLLDQMYSDGKVHPTFNLGGASSGRLSCSDPNLQQLPRPVEMPSEPSKEKCLIDSEKPFSEDNFDEEKYNKLYAKYERDLEKAEFWKFYEIRDALIPNNPDHSLIALDFSNLEMRLLAHFSQDPNLVETFLEDKDAHGSTAVNMFALDCSPDEAKKKYKSLRQIAKVINFLLMYGGGASTLFDTLAEQDAVDENGDPITKEKAREYYDKYFEAYNGVKSFINNQKKYAHRHEMIYTLIGRKRRLPDINNGNFKMIAYEERLAVNACIQGSGADIMMVCQPRIDNNERLKELECTMILQVHDELVFDCPDKNVEEATKIIKNIMEHPLPKPLNVPLRADADSGKSYAEAK